MKYVDNANQELDALGKENLHLTAVVDKQFQGAVGESKPQGTDAKVTVTAYEPNEIHYDVQSAAGGVVVFSEVYYPGWTATVDGKSVEVGRANYVLRAVNVTPGAHKVVLTFKPQSITTTETIAYVSLALLALTLIACVVLGWRRGR